MIRGIVFAHVNLGLAFCEAVESFLGPQEDLIGLSNTDLSHESMVTVLEETVGPAPDGAIIFTALYGGSCWQVAERYCREHSGAYHLTNTSLPMLLTFINRRSTTPLADLAESLLNREQERVRS